MDHIKPVVGTPRSNEQKEKLVNEAIENLKKRLIKESKPLQAEFSRTVDKHFWRLI